MNVGQWVHVAFTWSSQNKAQLYKGNTFQSRTDAIRLNNGYDESITTTSGIHDRIANCTVGDELDIKKQFIGSLDEFYIFSRELQQNEIEELNSTANFLSYFFL
ncbi:unnamed protein product [Rotaria sp. Silwood2]|nr:unnamed protein product [Rotaria sp. Silwood2]CAF3317733.1 unnamed protein product [Rotaria sp. Silwood2]CAF3341116.1 unnamed protein product [Rotaria sp. Silwood2]CAF4204880.1 unnamed protein product [Rotaria sp. Silwood2]CAF4251810.1 unnamed protein product [Rotaria sp. Silwood2]